MITVFMQGEMEETSHVLDPVSIPNLSVFAFYFLVVL